MSSETVEYYKLYVIFLQNGPLYKRNILLESTALI
jgi:hypothetical protein